MEKIRKTQKKYCSIAITIAIFAGIFFILLDLKPIGKGLILGTIFSIFNFILMGEALPMKIGISRARASAFSFFSILFRYGLLAVPLVLSIKFDRFHLVATVCGLFMIQFLILADNVLRLIFFETKKKSCDNKLLWKS
jgi:membrane-bound ClpP family serine protease